MMALYRVNPEKSHYPGDRRKDAPALSLCPICRGKMQMVYKRNNQQVIVCMDCHSGVTVPGAAWAIARAKRHARG